MRNELRFFRRSSAEQPNNLQLVHKPLSIVEELIRKNASWFVITSAVIIIGFPKALMHLGFALPYI
jgi:hypothetical protein